MTISRDTELCAAVASGRRSRPYLLNGRAFHDFFLHIAKFAPVIACAGTRIEVALRAVVSTHDVDTFLTAKDAVTSAFEEEKADFRCGKRLGKQDYIVAALCHRRSGR